MTRTRGRAAAAAVLAAATITATATTSHATTLTRTWGVNGHVGALTVAGQSVIVGGSFTALVSPSGTQVPATSLAKFDPASGTFDTGWGVTIDGRVDAVAVAGGTVYLGGKFKHVGGASRLNLAAVSLSTGAVQSWAPRVNVSVGALAVIGADVYVGGAFKHIADQSGTVRVPYLARVTTGGTVDRAWTGGVTLDGLVRSLQPTADGSGIYVGGDFLTVDGASSGKSLTLLTAGAHQGVDPTFRSGPNNDGHRSPAFALSLDGNRLLIAAGGAGGGCTMQNATTGATLWSHHTNGNGQAALIRGSLAYCGGHFSGTASFDGFDRKKIAEMDAATGVVTSFAPRINSALGVFALADTSPGLAVGGDFTKISGKPQPRLAVFTS